MDCECAGSKIPICISGDRLCGISDAKPGSGTYVKNGLIFASIRGMLNITLSNNSDGEVTSVHKTYVRCTIMSVNNVSTTCPFNGVIHKRSIRTYRRDILETINCFKPGDIVLARVISLGEPESYYLSTLEPELGVVIGLSKTNERMYPVSWNRMRVMNTTTPSKSESRKVARVRPEYAETEETVEADD